MTNQFNQVFASVPTQLRKHVQEHFEKIRHDHALGRYESSELNGGKFCEAVLSVLEWFVKSEGVEIPGKPTNSFEKRIRRIMVLSCDDLLESFRLNVPDILLSVYRIRSKRGVAHANGHVDPNFMDSSFVVAAANWVMAELVRMLHDVSVDEAKNMVESLVTKQIPLIWRIEDRTRVISPPGATLSYDKKVLVVLYSNHPEPITVDDLFLWTRHSNKSVFRNKVLRNLDQSDMIDVEPGTDLVRLSLLGVSHVEKHIPLDFEYS